jgi:hypothetical protein
MKKARSIKVFVCGVDYQHEIGQAADGNKVFPSIGAIQKHMSCVNDGWI